MTSRELNVRSLLGVLSINLIDKRYFDGKHTSATIISTETFTVEEGTNLLFEIRASFSNYTYPEIYLLDEDTIKSEIPSRITLLSYKENILWYGLSQFNITNATNKEVSNRFDLERFNIFQVKIFNNTFEWYLNGQVHLLRDFFHDKVASDRHFRFKNISTTYKIAIVNHYDDRFNIPDQTSRNTCYSLLLDYIKVFKFKSHEEEEILNEKANVELNSQEICDKTNSLNDQWYLKFKKNNDLKLVWWDEFNGTHLDQSKWNIVSNVNKCQS